MKKFLLLIFAALFLFAACAPASGGENEEPAGEDISAIVASPYSRFASGEAGWNTGVRKGYPNCFFIDDDGVLWCWNNSFTSNPEINSTMLKPVIFDPKTEDPDLRVSDLRFRHAMWIDTREFLFLDTNGKLYEWGPENKSVYLGLTTTKGDELFHPVYPELTFSRIDCGGGHYLAIDMEGNLYSWGNNAYGAVGDGKCSSLATGSNSRSTPFQIKEGTKFKDIATGYQSSYAIDADGNLYTWGRNVEGQLGNGEVAVEPDRADLQGIGTDLFPQKIARNTKFQRIWAGTYSAYALDEDGGLWSWGRNQDGELGQGIEDETIVKTPTRVATEKRIVQIITGDTMLALDEAGGLWGCGWNSHIFFDDTIESISTMIRLLPDKTFVQIHRKGGLVYALDESGTVWGWGKSFSAYLGEVPPAYKDRSEYFYPEPVKIPFEP